jgi:hypothetical protein
MLYIITVLIYTVYFYLETNSWKHFIRLAVWIARPVHGIHKHAADVLPSKDRPFGREMQCPIKPAPCSAAQ